MGDHATTNDPSTTDAAFAEKGKGKAQDPELSMEEDSSSESENGDEMVSPPCALLIISIERHQSPVLIYGNRSTTVHSPSSPPPADSYHRHCLFCPIVMPSHLNG